MDKSKLPIGIFDSGVGGISTLDACLNRLKSESFIYLADKSGMPYGSKSGEQITARAEECVCTLIGEGVKAIVVACNTATNVGIAELRGKYDLPFVGVEPAIKPAVEKCRRGNILVLLTPATASQKKFLDLLARCDNGKIIVSPQPSLASLVERHIDDIERLRETVYAILSRYRAVEGVVLGCTHYAFLRGLINDFYGGKIRIFDSGDGVATRLESVLSESSLLSENFPSSRRTIRFIVI